MSYVVRVTRSARSDLLRLTDFVSTYGDDVAARCTAMLWEAMASLSEMPARHPLTSDELRELKLPFGASGYVIRYRVDADAVVIARIFHAREER